ncbi:MAG TPA: hypothetical protein VFX28_11155, partial [Methylomirabilota bacterium]|nr:hypothetical protein [Methylomirabilota bacterium]
MSLAVYLVVTFGFAAAAVLTRDRAPWSVIAGIGGLLAATIAAIAIDPGEAVAMGGGELATTAYLRLFLILGSAVGIGLAVTGLAGRTHRALPAVTLVTLGFAALTLGLADQRAAVLAGTAGGVCGAVLAVRPGGDRAGATVAICDLRAVVVAGALALAATAWMGRDLQRLDASPVVFGLAYLAVALAVAI